MDALIKIRFAACSAETRFQGIATQFHQLSFPSSLPPESCSAETRFQGIATGG